MEFGEISSVIIIHHLFSLVGIYYCMKNSRQGKVPLCWGLCIYFASPSFCWKFKFGILYSWVILLPFKFEVKMRRLYFILQKNFIFLYVCIFFFLSNCQTYEVLIRNVTPVIRSRAFELQLVLGI